jgi:hypothetical protein
MIYHFSNKTTKMSNKLRVTSNTPFFAFCLLLSALFFLAGCARIVIPSGGPKDITPPKVVGEKPANGSVKFTGKTIRIYFDEFVTLNNPVENVIFSPPLNKPIDYSTKGKSVIVKLNDTLRSNTTYNIHFSDCIQDFREGNKLTGYDYAFSTGDSIDKHKLFGRVENAETNLPETGCFVMLYEDDVDSLPLTTRPYYLTRTNAQGNFFFHHVKPLSYKIFALRDINFNFFYDLPNESIAFVDSMCKANYYSSDSLMRVDSSAFITLRMFQEEDTVQLLEPTLNPQKGIYHFPYKIPVHSYNLQIKGDSVVEYFSKICATRDTISLYFKTFFKDSATVYIITDAERMDTVELLPFKAPPRVSKNQKPLTSTLKVNLANKDELYAPTLLRFSYPIKPADSVPLLVIATVRGEKDTTEIYLNIPDSLVLQLPVPFAFEPKINYNLLLKDSLFYGYDGTTHDTIVFTLSKKTEKDYGNLFINYKVINKNADFIVELQSNQKTLRKDIISHSKTVEYKHLSPGNYSFKVTEDRNRNGKWDTGNYRKKIQPEKIFFIDKEITIRGFWDMEEEIELLAP